MLGQFEYGPERPIGQIVLAQFANPHGLEEIREGVYHVGVESGAPILYATREYSGSYVFELPDGYFLRSDGAILTSDQTAPWIPECESPLSARYPWSIRSKAIELEDDVFFQVETGPGESVYSRDGRFRLDANRYLVDLEGRRVLGYAPEGGITGEGLDTTQLVPLRVPLGGVEIARATQLVAIGGAWSEGSEIEFTVYEGLGIPHRITLRTSVESDGEGFVTHSWIATAPQTNGGDQTVEILGGGQVVFVEGGPLVSGAVGSIAIPGPRGQGATFEINFERTTSEGPLPLSVTSADGHMPVPITAFSLSPTGLLFGETESTPDLLLGQIKLTRLLPPLSVTGYDDTTTMRTPRGFATSDESLSDPVTPLYVLDAEPHESDALGALDEHAESTLWDEVGDEAATGFAFRPLTADAIEA